jgi:hypothetical protein
MLNLLQKLSQFRPTVPQLPKLPTLESAIKALKYGALTLAATLGLNSMAQSQSLLVDNLAHGDCSGQQYEKVPGEPLAITALHCLKNEQEKELRDAKLLWYMTPPKNMESTNTDSSSTDFGKVEYLRDGVIALSMRGASEHGFQFSQLRNQPVRPRRIFLQGQAPEGKLITTYMQNAVDEIREPIDVATQHARPGYSGAAIRNLIQLPSGELVEEIIGVLQAVGVEIDATKKEVKINPGKEISDSTHTNKQAVTTQTKKYEHTIFVENPVTGKRGTITTTSNSKNKDLITKIEKGLLQ